MKKKYIIVGILIIVVLYIFWIANMKATNDYQKSFPVPQPSKIVTPPFPNGNCPTANCKG